MTSLVVYVVLLSAFTTIAITVSNNLSSNIFVDKGEAINLSNYDKLLYYLNKSAIESASYKVLDNEIIFSNSNIFKYNDINQTIYYNNGILCNNVTKFECNNSLENLLTLKIGFKKYAHELDRDIILYVGGNV